MRAAHEDLQKENESLRAKQISSAQEGFEPPCLKCIERDNATSVAECSTAATVAISSTVDVVTNPSAEDTTAIADENARLKTLLETGMYKSLKGHQTLCDVLKRQILNRNPRKEGVGFERKMNADGSYWKREQYPKPHGLLQRNLQWIQPLYLDLPMLILLSLMNPLMQTINCSKIRMVKCLPGTLVLTAGMDHL